MRRALPVPITGVVSDGQDSIRKAVAKALPGIPDQLCHFHYLREAAKPIYEADRHAKKELKKRVRGIRPIERQEEGSPEAGDDDPEAEVVRDYCAAVRAALTVDGLPPLAASGLKLGDRLSQIAASLDRVAATAGKLPGGLKRLQQLLRRGLDQTADRFPVVHEAYQWVKRVAHILKNESELPAKKVRRRLVQLLAWMRRAAATTQEPWVGTSLKHFRNVTKSYWPGLFRCYDATDLPRTNNDLEHTFGSHRYHERRASGRRRASPGLVVMGSARVISGLATRLRRMKGWSCGPAMWRAGRSCARIGAAARIASQAAALPPSSGRLSQRIGATLPPANFATLVFFGE